jgi:Fe-S-cluster containining protein
MLAKFTCIDGCSDCCNYREYFPSVKYGKIGVILLPEEKTRIESLAKKMNKKLRILPRIGIGRSKRGKSPKNIIAYQMMGKKLNGNLCPFLANGISERSPHGGFKCTIYDERPLACRAYPIVAETKSYAVLDSKCQFCHKKNSSTIVEKNSVKNEIESLKRIKSEISIDKGIEVWRYATAIGDFKDKSKFLPEGWVLQDI